MRTTLLIIGVLAGLAIPVLGQTCLQSPPGLPGGNGQNGAMFDVQATGGSVIIQTFNQAFSGVGTTCTIEVYAVTGGGSFVGNETNAGAWTLLATVPNVFGTGPGVADPLNLSLGFVIPNGTTQGFYITCAGGPSIDYTNGTGTPGVTPVVSDSFITIYEGVGKAYPFSTTFTPRNWNGEVCYLPAAGLYANFSGTPTSGPGPLTVQFTDTTFTSDPNGVQTWAWSFGDGGTSTQQNPSHTYTCPGSHDVTLTVTDTMFPQSSITKMGYVTVSQPVLTMTTTGMGDLSVFPIGTQCYPTALSGYTLVSFATTPGSPGGGPFLGLRPDASMFVFLFMPAQPGNIAHFLVTGVTYPDAGPVLFPVGFFSSLSGMTMDAVEILLPASGVPLLISNVAQVTF